jgi:hypothetical protein
MQRLWRVYLISAVLACLVAGGTAFVLVRFAAPPRNDGAVTRDQEGRDESAPLTKPAPPIRVVAILPITNQWNMPYPGWGKESEWEKQSHIIIELFEDRLATAFVETPVPAPWRLIPTRATPSRSAREGDAPLERGSKLGAGAVLTGVVSGKGQLNLQLLEVPSGAVLWAMNSKFTYKEDSSSWAIDYPHEDLPKVVTGVSEAIARANNGRSP